MSAKQWLAFLSWLLKRRHVSTLVPVRALLDDLAAHAPDHVAVTGDLTNMGLAAECAAARRWLQRLGPPDRVSVLPGNHDRTARRSWADGVGQWVPWMEGDPGTGSASGSTFPFLRRREQVAIIGLCSAVPTRLGSAAGALGAEQIRRAATLLDRAGQEELFRVVLIHHPPVMGEGGRRKALRDRDAMAAMLQRSGAELVLHGHHHRSRRTVLPGPVGLIPVVGVPAALAAVPRPELATWHLHRVERGTSGWEVTTLVRRYDPLHDRFETVRQDRFQVLFPRR